MRPDIKAFIILLLLLISLIGVSVSSALDKSSHSNNQEVSTK